MSNEQPQHVVGRIVKMDGEWEGKPFPDHPETHPDCSEILEFSSNDPQPKVIYRRD